MVCHFSLTTPARMLRWDFPPMPAFDAIFFDFDGVLIDSEPVHWACWREVLLPLGVIARMGVLPRLLHRHR